LWRKEIKSIINVKTLSLIMISTLVCIHEEFSLININREDGMGLCNSECWKSSFGRKNKNFKGIRVEGAFELRVISPLSSNHSPAEPQG
jgi:hypothetical protein